MTNLMHQQLVKQYSVAEACAKILDGDDESLLRTNFDLSIGPMESDQSDATDVVNQIGQTLVSQRSKSLLDSKAFFEVRLSIEHGVFKRRYELYFGKNCGFLLIRLFISAITRRARS